MKQILLSFIFCNFFLLAHSQTQEKLIRNFYAGFEKKEWNMGANQLAEDFAFTSPNGDDHLNMAQYEEKCWGTSRFFKHIDFPRIMVDGNNAFAIYDITTTDGNTVHNVEYYTFKNNKIKSIEVFFGTGIHYPGNSGK